jgi:hypothetical protein
MPIFTQTQATAFLFICQSTHLPLRPAEKEGDHDENGDRDLADVRVSRARTTATHSSLTSWSLEEGSRGDRLAKWWSWLEGGLGF